MPILARRRRATSRARCEALMSYSLLHVLHLLGAIAFIGTLFFEVIILAKVKPQLAPGAVLELEQALGKRSRTVLHWVVLLVYGAGLGLAWYHRQALHDPFASRSEEHTSELQSQSNLVCRRLL